MLKRLPLVGVAIGIALSASPASAAPILLANFTPIQSIGFAGLRTHFIIDLSLWPSHCGGPLTPTDTAGALAGCGFVVPSGTTGVFDFDQNNAPNFALIAAKLTDDIDDPFISIYQKGNPGGPGFGGGGGMGGGESAMFGGLLTGAQIAFIRLNLRTATIQPVIGGAMSTVFLEWEIWGTGTPLPIHPHWVPEPGSYAAILSGLVILGIWRGRRAVAPRATPM